MSLQLILGGSGAGKSYYLYQSVVQESRTNPQGNVVVLVPEQFTLQTQKELVTMHPDLGIMNIDVLSFLRLAYRILEEERGNLPILDDTGKNMMLRKVLQEVEPELKIFRAQTGRQGFIEETKSLLSELFQYHITKEKLSDLRTQEKLPALLDAKLQDLTIIYNKFMEFKESRYITAEEILLTVLELVPHASLLKGSTVCLDGFTGFTPVQYAFLRGLLEVCEKVVVTVTLDERESYDDPGEDYQLFHLSKRTIEKLTQIAEEVGTVVEEPVCIPGNYRFRENPVLQALEKNLFRYPFVTYPKDPEEKLQLILCHNMEDEVREILRQIKNKREEGFRYREMAVVTAAMEPYGKRLLETLRGEHIPVFLDQKFDIMGSPLGEFLLGALEMAWKNGTYESVFRFLRSGLTSFTPEEIDTMENYILARGIRSFYGYEKPWKEEVEPLRLRFLEIIGEEKEVLMNAQVSVRERAKALFLLMEKEQVFEKMGQDAKTLEETLSPGDLLPVWAENWENIYEKVCDLLDQMVLILGEEKTGRKEFYEIFQSGLEEIKVGQVPFGIDQIVIGDTDRTRLKDIKVLFFPGVNDGIVPGAEAPGGLLGRQDREELEQRGIELSPTGRQNAFTDEFYLYLNLTKPNEQLILTYSTIDRGGNAIRPSYLIGKLLHLFPGLTVQQESLRKGELDRELALNQGKEFLADAMREEKMESPLWKGLLWWNQKEGKTETITQLFQGACYENATGILSQKAVELLYGEALKGSVTRLEEFAACPFSYFMDYGLTLEPRKEYRVEAVDYGTIVHLAVQIFGEKLAKGKIGWEEVKEEDRLRFSKESLEEACAAESSEVFFQDHRSSFLITRMEKLLERTTWALCHQVAAGGFRPEAYELPFTALPGLIYPLSNGKELVLSGKIDRLDTWKKDGEIYVKVLDYKTGQTVLDLSRLYYGQQLQLMVYLKAGCQWEEREHPEAKVKPAGVLYYQVMDPFINKNEPDASGALLQELCPTGRMNGDPTVLTQMDYTLGEKEELFPLVKSRVIPVETDKNGGLKGTSSTLSLGEIERLSHHTDAQITKLGSRIMEGEVSVRPVSYQGRTGCDFCPYGTICGFDARLPGFSYDHQKKLKDTEIMERLAGEADGNR